MSAPLPKNVDSSPVVTPEPAQEPNAVLFLEVVFCRANAHIAVFSSPETFVRNDNEPTAVL